MFITDKTGRLYLHNITNAESRIIRKLQRSLAEYKQCIVLPVVAGMPQIQRLASLLLENDPSQVAVTGFRFLSSPVTVQIQPIYTYPETQGRILLEECKIQRNKIIQRVNARKNGYDIVKGLHDILSRNISYVAGESPELHSIVGPLTKKVGVCEGFAKAMKFLLDALSIPSIVVMGTGYNQIAQQVEPHAWNLVQIDGEWTHIDLTFNTTIREHNIPRYDYFGLSNEEILKDHKYDVSSYPEAKSKSLSYYERNGLVMRKKSSLNAFLMETLQAGKKDIVFKLPDAASEKNVEVQVTTEINSFFSQNNFYMGYMLYYNTKQKVFQVHLEG